MKYRITHITKYESSKKVSIGMNEVFLVPRETGWQLCSDYKLTTTPPASFKDERIDYFGNKINYFSFERGYKELVIKSTSVVSVLPRNAENEDFTPTRAELRTQLSERKNIDDWKVYEFMSTSPLVPRVDSAMKEYTENIFTKETSILEGLRKLLSIFKTEFEFDPTATTVNTPVSEVFEKRRGVCQDFAHTLIAMVRSIGLPARYVSGYLRTIPAPGQPRLRGVDASHAWVSVYCGKLGWIDIDPTNDCFTAQDHITVAWGRDYSDVPPVAGVVIGAGIHALKVTVDVEPIED